MPTAEAQVETARPARYLAHLCRHASAMSGGHRPHTRDVQVHAEWSDTEGAIHFTPWGECTMTATATTLILRINAADEDGLRQIQNIISADLTRFGRRDDVTVTWHQA